MLVTTLLAVLVTQSNAVVCPIMGKPVVNGAGVSEYAGVRYSYCCAGCREEFEKDPAAAIGAAAKEGKVVGVGLFDPVSRRRLDSNKAKGGSADFGGTRYFFENAADKQAFDKDPKQYAVAPRREALFCPVMKQPVSQYDAASAYADFEDVRYYFCCGGCDTSFAKDPTGYAKGVADKVQAPRALRPKETKSPDIAFACKHCGRTLKLKDKADLDRTCTACSCGKSMRECQPSGR